MTLLPELAERDASGETAAIYGEIRRLGGVPMVALIFRHLATLPGALEWMWSALGPAWRSGELQEAAWRIAREAPLVPIARMPRPALAALGVDEAALREIDDVLVAYNRANPVNMLSVLCTLRMAEGRVVAKHRLKDNGGAEGKALWKPPKAPGPLVPMGDLATLPSEVNAVLDLVAAPGEPGSPRVVQSLYRHFTHRPAFLALAVTLLRQRFDDGSIDAAVREVHARMSQAADRIVAAAHAPKAPHPGIVPVCTRFGGGVIPQMIVVGRLLEEALS